MKKIITIAFILISVISFAQTGTLEINNAKINGEIKTNTTVPNVIPDRVITQDTTNKITTYSNVLDGSVIPVISLMDTIPLYLLDSIQTNKIVLGDSSIIAFSANNDTSVAMSTMRAYVAANGVSISGNNNELLISNGSGGTKTSSNLTWNDTIFKVKFLSTNILIGDTVNSGFTGSDNVFLGVDAGVNNTAGNRNTYLGRKSGFDASIANNNVFVGYQSGINTTNSNAVAVGFDTDVGTNSVSVGFQAGRLQTSSASNNMFIGYQSGYSNLSGSGNVFLGYQAGYNETGSNKLYIENSNSATPLIGGDFSTDVVTINSVLKLAPLANAPTSPVLGMIYVNSTDNHIYFYNGSTWVQLDN